MSNCLKSTRRLLAAAIAYREWSRTTIPKWAEAWSVDPGDLRDVVWMLMKDADRRGDEGE